MKRCGIILLVEDTPDDVELTRRAFERSGVVNEIVVVTDGQEALDYLFGEGAYSERDLARMPELILLDLKLPRVDGLDVLSALRKDERTRRLPVVVLSSSNEPKDRMRSYDLGANSFVQKPVDFAEFLVAAHQLGDYWLTLNQPAPLSSVERGRP